LNELLAQRKKEQEHESKDDIGKKEHVYMMNPTKDSYLKALNFKRYQQDYPGFERPSSVN